VKRVSEPLLGLQQRLGNQAVGRMLDRQLDAGKQLMTSLQRQEPEESADQGSQVPGQTEADEVDLGRLEIEGKLPGHPYASGVPTVMTQSTEQTSALTAKISLNKQTPSEVRMPAADIATKHGKPDVAGWCTPLYNIQASKWTGKRIDLDANLGFRIELASEYSGDTLSVLRDHEYGHVKIGEQEARTHLVKGLEEKLEGLPGFRNKVLIEAMFEKAQQDFVDAEEKKSKDYDAVDYPRMEQAYIGAGMPLADLRKSSPAIDDMSKALKALDLPWADLCEKDRPDLVGRLQAAIDAYQALSKDEVSRVQYNSEFKALVAQCQARLDDFAPYSYWDYETHRISLLGDNEDKMWKLDDILRIGFTWRPSV